MRSSHWIATLGLGLGLTWAPGCGGEANPPAAASPPATERTPAEPSPGPAPPAAPAPPVQSDPPPAAAQSDPPPAAAQSAPPPAAQRDPPPATGAPPPPAPAPPAAPVASEDPDAAGQDPPGLAALRLKVETLLRGHTDRDEERQVLELLRGASPGELDRLVRRLDLAGLLSSLDDHTWGPQHRSQLLTLLTRERLADLSVPARAALVDALQRGDTDAPAERAIEAVLLGTHGAALTRLKNAIDLGGDGRDLLQLVQHDLDDQGVRGRIQAHLAAEGASSPRAGLKVLHDIDDTLFSSLNDPRWPGGAVYPGILALQRELTRGAGQGTGGELVFLSARPGDRAHVVEGQTFATLAGMGVGPATILTGGMLDFRSNEAMAAGKRANFDAYRALFPEYRFVFLGDSGQGDVPFGQGILRDHPDLVRVVLIHDVVATPAARRAELAAEGVLLVDTWLGGAVEAHARGLIDARGLARVAEQALGDLERLELSAETRAARRAELLADLARANAALPEGLRVRAE